MATFRQSGDRRRPRTDADRLADRERRALCDARKRAGLILVTFETDEIDLSEFLIGRGHLDYDRATDRAAISEAVREMVEGMVAAHA